MQLAQYGVRFVFSKSQFWMNVDKYPECHFETFSRKVCVHFPITIKNSISNRKLFIEFNVIWSGKMKSRECTGVFSRTWSCSSLGSWSGVGFGSCSRDSSQFPITIFSAGKFSSWSNARHLPFPSAVVRSSNQSLYNSKVPLWFYFSYTHFIGGLFIPCFLAQLSIFLLVASCFWFLIF